MSPSGASSLLIYSLMSCLANELALLGADTSLLSFEKSYSLSMPFEAFIFILIWYTFECCKSSIFSFRFYLALSSFVTLILGSVLENLETTMVNLERDWIWSFVLLRDTIIMINIRYGWAKIYCSLKTISILSKEPWSFSYSS